MHHRFDLVLRFENLQSDFSKMLEMVGAAQVRPLPRRNATEQRNASHLQYYTPEALEHAKRIFGPFMQRWGYEFPPEWDHVPALQRLQFTLLSIPRTAYWKFLHYNSSPRGRRHRAMLGLGPREPAPPPAAD